MSPASFRSILSATIALVLLSGCADSGHLRPFYKKPAFAGLSGLLGPWAPGASDQPLVPGETLPTPPAGKPKTFWEDNGSRAQPVIVVRLGEQRAYFYRGRKVVGATHISTGKKGYTTPTGHYAVIQRDEHHSSSLYGEFVDGDGSVVKANVDTTKDSAPAGSHYRGAKMPYFLRFSGGHGLHSGLTPDHPASHGCVRLPAAMAKHFFDNAPMGTPVWVED